MLLICVYHLRVFGVWVVENSLEPSRWSLRTSNCCYHATFIRQFKEIKVGGIIKSRLQAASLRFKILITTFNTVLL